MKQSEYNKILAESLPREKIEALIESMSLDFEVNERQIFGLEEIDAFFWDGLTEDEEDEGDQELPVSDDEDEVPAELLEALKQRYSVELVISLVRDAVEQCGRHFAYGFPADEAGNGSISVSDGSITCYVEQEVEVEEEEEDDGEDEDDGEEDWEDEERETEMVEVGPEPLEISWLSVFEELNLG